MAALSNASLGTLPTTNVEVEMSLLETKLIFGEPHVHFHDCFREGTTAHMARFTSWYKWRVRYNVDKQFEVKVAASASSSSSSWSSSSSSSSAALYIIRTAHKRWLKFPCLTPQQSRQSSHTVAKELAGTHSHRQWNHLAVSDEHDCHDYTPWNEHSNLHRKLPQKQR